ncbi:hypothetical protein FQN50_003840 [Emmonsiellopsis sp. PD_5]|nr:hypothetical protein FQN50_003840 [Emmonsiellopsis sp. PD_5]
MAEESLLFEAIAAQEKAENESLEETECYQILPLERPLAGAVSEETVFIASICTHVENSQNSELSLHRLCPLTGEPDPSIDYENLTQFILEYSNTISPSDLSTFRYTSYCRRRYFEIYRFYFRVEARLLDLLTERSRLKAKGRAKAAGQTAPTPEEIEEHERLCAINVRGVRFEASRFRLYERGLTLWTRVFAQAKHIALETFERLRTRRTLQQHITTNDVGTACTPAPTDPMLVDGPIEKRTVRRRTTKIWRRDPPN